MTYTIKNTHGRPIFTTTDPTVIDRAFMRIIHDWGGTVVMPWPAASRHAPFRANPETTTGAQRPNPEGLDHQI